MLRVLSVTEFDAVADAYGARALLATHPRVDADRIGVIGFSYGGMAARFAMDERIREVLAPGERGFAAFIDSLRGRYAAQTRWFESNLALVGLAR